MDSKSGRRAMFQPFVIYKRSKYRKQFESVSLALLEMRSNLLRGDFLPKVFPRRHDFSRGPRAKWRPEAPSTIDSKNQIRDAGRGRGKPDPLFRQSVETPDKRET